MVLDVQDLMGMATIVLILALMLILGIVFITGIVAAQYGSSPESFLSEC
jgi:hypothetical protein